MKKAMYRVLRRGNGHQATNRVAAMAFAVEHLGATMIDESTVKIDDLGVLHFAAYTSPDGAMVSTPARGPTGFGDEPWHSKERILMLRETGDDRMIAYVCAI